jgi:hypothetical protein
MHRPQTFAPEPFTAESIGKFARILGARNLENDDGSSVVVSRWEGHFLGPIEGC